MFKCHWYGLKVMVIIIRTDTVAVQECNIVIYSDLFRTGASDSKVCTRVSFSRALLYFWTPSVYCSKIMFKPPCE